MQAQERGPVIQFSYHPALFDALSTFVAEFDSQVCGVCGNEKWAQSPFCRRCSIVLQRAGLMRRLKYLREGQPGQDSVSEAIRYFRFWDLCRDYLITKRGARRQND